MSNAKGQGRRPKPTRLKIVSNTFRKDRTSPNEPHFLMVLPDPPAFLNELAREEWIRISIALNQSGVLTEVDVAVLSGYCQSYGRWVLAEMALAKVAAQDAQFSGLMVRTKNGNVHQNPLLLTAQKACVDMVRYGCEFGLSPSSRTRINAEQRAADEDEAAEFFGE